MWWHNVPLWLVYIKVWKKKTEITVIVCQGPSGAADLQCHSKPLAGEIKTLLGNRETDIPFSCSDMLLINLQSVLPCVCLHPSSPSPSVSRVSWSHTQGFSRFCPVWASAGCQSANRSQRHPGGQSCSRYWRPEPAALGSGPEGRKNVERNKYSKLDTIMEKKRDNEQQVMTLS